MAAAPQESGDPFHPVAAWIELPGKRTFILTGDCHIGRTEGNEIVNPDSRISRRNSLVQRERNHFVLVDLGSTNGTYLNEVRIFKPTRLKDKDVILVGSERYVFRQPPESGGSSPATDPAYSMVNRTAAAVGKTSCWMLRASPEAASVPAAAAWAEQLRPLLERSGAGVRRLPESVLFAHWREGRTGPEAVRDLVVELAGQPRPPGARLVLHHGTVRISRAADPSEENLLGADVAFAHRLAVPAARLGVDVLLSEPAVRTLGLQASVRALGEQAVPDAAGKHELFALEQR